MVLGVIPARGGSKELPGKNVRLLAGVPLIVHTIRAARASARLDDVVVTTDDPAIAEVARAAGAGVPCLRPAALATDEISIWPAVRHAVAEWEARRADVAETVVLLQPTSPLRNVDDIDACIQVFYAREADICASVCRPHDSPYFNMVEPDAGSGFIRPCSPLMRTSDRRQEGLPVYALNGGVYVVRRAVLDSLTNQFTIERFAVCEMPRARSVDIDTQEDLALAEWWLARQQAT